MDIFDTSFKGDKLMCQIQYHYVKGQKVVVRTQNNVKNPVNKILRSNAETASGS